MAVPRSVIFELTALRTGIVQLFGSKAHALALRVENEMCEKRLPSAVWFTASYSDRLDLYVHVRCIDEKLVNAYVDGLRARLTLLSAAPARVEQGSSSSLCICRLPAEPPFPGSRIRKVLMSNWSSIGYDPLTDRRRLELIEHYRKQL